MSDDGSKHPISSEEIRKYTVSITRLDNHLDEQASKVKDTIQILDDLQGLKNIRCFADIGEGAEEWINALSKNYNFNTGFGIISTTLNQEDKNKLRKQLEAWKTRFVDRLESETVVVTPQTELSIEKLISGPSAYLDISNLEKYEHESKDLHQASASMIIGAFTCSEFMSLRAVESILRKWHMNEVDEESQYNGWAAAIDDISENDDGKGPKELRLLNYLRERRNEVAHPDRHSSQSDAELTFQQSIDVVEKLVAELEADQ